MTTSIKIAALFVQTGGMCTMFEAHGKQLEDDEADAAAHLNWADDADNQGTIEIAVPRQSEKNLPVIVKPVMYVVFEADAASVQATVAFATLPLEHVSGVAALTTPAVFLPG